MHRWSMSCDYSFFSLSSATRQPFLVTCFIGSVISLRYLDRPSLHFVSAPRWWDGRFRLQFCASFNHPRGWAISLKQTAIIHFLLFKLASACLLLFETISSLTIRETPSTRRQEKDANLKKGGKARGKMSTTSLILETSRRKRSQTSWDDQTLLLAHLRRCTLVYLSNTVQKSSA